MHAAPCAASSWTMALPTGWVAPVTMQMKPYWSMSTSKNDLGIADCCRAYQLAI